MGNEKAKHETLAGARAWLRKPEGLSAPQDTVNLSLRILNVNRLYKRFCRAFFYEEPISKIGFWFKIKAGPRFNPPRLLTGSSTRILKYSGELKLGPNTEVGPKDFFEMASRKGYGKKEADV
jgi:hypothetical protein